MRPASDASQRPPDARLLAIDAYGTAVHTLRSRLGDHLRPGDVLVANDAATIPASLHGIHVPTGESVEIRLAGRGTLAEEDVRAFTAVVFGAGDWRMRTEDRPAPPRLEPGDELRLGPLRAIVRGTRGHPRLVTIGFTGTPDEVWDGLARHGRPVQYAYLSGPLALWDVWTSVAARPVAFESPSAGFVLDWRLLSELRARDIGFATLTHAAGLSSTGDPELDARLPLAEPYDIPESTVRAIERARARGGRVVAVGTTVTRALEHAAARPHGLTPGTGLATQRIDEDTELHVVDVLLTGIHEPGDSHFDLMRAFAGADVLARMSCALERGGYRTHEFGDSVLLERQHARVLERGGDTFGRIAVELADPRRLRTLARERPAVVEAWAAELVRRVGGRAAAQLSVPG